MPHVRCSKCRGRRTLARDPKQYVRLPRCAVCLSKMDPDPVTPFVPHYTLDRYRTRKERGKGMKLCYPGRGGCFGYSFPHRHGSGYCEHNPNLTEAMRRERETDGNWA